MRDTVYWWETEPVETTPPLIGNERADVCIVGADYTGLWTTYHLKEAEPSLDVVVVDATWAARHRRRVRAHRLLRGRNERCAAKAARSRPSRRAADGPGG